MLYGRATIQALQSQIDDLKARLEQSESERKALQDLLLIRHNYEPVSKAEVRPSSAPALQVIAPFGVQPADIAEPMREAWIENEAEWLEENTGLDEMRARSEAERRYLSQNRAIKLN